MKILTAAQLGKPRSRRLRKKLRIGEFQELCFEVELHFDVQKLDVDAVLDRWIEFVEDQGWAYGGGASRSDARLSGVVCHPANGSLSEADRTRADAWLKAQDWVRDHKLSALKDAWHELAD